MVDLIWLFFRLGATSFGGPAAHIALMEEEFVHRRKWLSREKFLDLLAITNLIPGPNSTELAIHIGYHKAGWWGFWLAGSCFILPAFLIVTTLAYFYTETAGLPQTQDFLLGVKAVVLAVIVQAFERFFRNIFRMSHYRELFRASFWKEKNHVLNIFILLSSVYLSLRGFSEISILLNCGLISLFVTRRFSAGTHHELGSIFWIFFKVGSVLFGSGYVLLSFLEAELVQKHHLITQSQLLDAISVGQFTPGPVFTTASFLGFILNGFSGAITATLGIFLPAFLFVAISIPLYQKMTSSVLLRSILDGVVVGSLSLLLMTLWTFGQGLISSPLAFILFAGSLVILLTTRIPSAVLIVVGGLLALIF